MGASLSKDAPIHAACARGDADAVRTLLAAGAEPHCVGADGTTPLTIASARGHLACVDALLAAGADIHTVDATKSKNTALHAAARGGHLDVAELLLARGADPRTTNSWGLTPLHQATSANAIEIVRVLLANDTERHRTNTDKDASDHVAFIDARSAYNRRALDLAVQEDFAPIVKLLLEAGADLEAPTNEDYTPLFVACMGQHEAVIRVLLAAGANPNVASNEGLTPVTVLAMNGRSDLVALLAAAGADTNPVAPAFQVTALHYSASALDFDGVELFLAKGANVNALDSAGNSPLYYAVDADSDKGVEITRKLLAAGAQVNVQNKQGATPLSVACTKGNVAVATLLLAAGADVLTRIDDTGFTSLHIAADLGHVDIVRLLLRPTGDNTTVNASVADRFGVTPLHFAAITGNVDVIAALLAGGANVNAADADGFTPLDYAQLATRNDAVRVLRDANGVTGGVAAVGDSDATTFGPLHAASKSSNVVVIERFLQAGVDANAAAPDGTTSLHAASQQSEEKVVKLLLKHGARADARTAAGSTPLQIATTMGHQGVAEALTKEEARMQRAHNMRLALGGLAATGLVYVAFRGRANWRAYHQRK